jgi:chemotaxis methyl-accepting protein methylase
VAGEDFSILATDVSRQALARALRGEYTKFEVSRGLTPERIARYFRKQGACGSLEKPGAALR